MKLGKPLNRVTVVPKSGKKAVKSTNGRMTMRKRQSTKKKA